MQIMKTGIDFDHAHPTCVSIIHSPSNCIPASADNPVDGDLLQVMPWPVFQNMSDRYLQAIYAYLSAIPCSEGRTGQSDRTGALSEPALRSPNFRRCGTTRSIPVPLLNPCVEGLPACVQKSLPINAALQ